MFYRVLQTPPTAQKMKLSIKDFFSADLVTFTEGILNEKLHFLCSVLFSEVMKDKNSEVRSMKFKLLFPKYESKRCCFEIFL